MRVRNVVIGTLLLLASAEAHAQSYAIQGAERYFRIEFSPAEGRRGRIVSGYVYNTYGNAADRVRLLVETLDGAGQVTSTTQAVVLGTVPPGDRAYFEVAVPRDGTSYRIRVLSFDWIGRGGP